MKLVVRMRRIMLRNHEVTRDDPSCFCISFNSLQGYVEATLEAPVLPGPSSAQGDQREREMQCLAHNGAPASIRRAQRQCAHPHARPIKEESFPSFVFPPARARVPLAAFVHPVPPEHSSPLKR